MKKRIQLAALESFQQMFVDESDKYTISLILDQPESKITEATLNRLQRVLEDMINVAESKL